MKNALSLTILLALSLPVRADNWMHRLPDDAYVSTLSIPGSHDTGTGSGFPGVTTSIYGPFGDKYARTQDINIEEQWNIGIRAFDFRPAIKDGYINVNHGIMPTKLRFDNALFFLRDKLRENPSEFAVIHLLHASAGDDNASNYGEKLLELFSRDDLKDFLVDFKSTLTVREMRGKILLLSRDEYADQPVGGFFRDWTGQVDWSLQTGGSIVGTNSTATLYMQDFAETHREGDLEVKVNAVRQLLDFSTKHKTTSAADIVWVYNLASAYSKTSRLYIPLVIDQQISSSDGYRDNAAHTNAAIIDYLSDPANTAGPTGIVLMDYVGVQTSNGYQTRGQEAVDAIIANNFRYLQDMYQVEESSATYLRPIDMSARITNPCFNSNLLSGWEGDGFGAVEPRENAEHFNRNFDTHQTITGLPNGVYAIGVKAFYRCGEAQEAYDHYRIKDRTLRKAHIYATTGSETLSFPLLSPFAKSVSKARNVGREISVSDGSASHFIPDDMISAEHYMHTLNGYNNLIFAGVEDHTLTFGVRKDQTEHLDWCVFDDFTLTYYGNQPKAYQRWLSEMKKKKLSYSGITVSKCYYDAHNAAYNAKPADRAEAIAAMQAIDAAAEDIALNAELWDAYKQAGAEAEAIINGSQYSQKARDFLREYYEAVYLDRLNHPTLTNLQLPAAIEDMRYYISLITTGEWTGLSAPGEGMAEDDMPGTLWTIDGKPLSRPLRHGLHVRQGSNGKTRKVFH